MCPSESHATQVAHACHGATAHQPPQSAPELLPVAVLLPLLVELPVPVEVPENKRRQLLTVSKPGAAQGSR
jgi:hypothetical protein